jgi:hypothetical protein
LIDKLAIQVGPDASAVDDVASLRLYDTSGLPLSDAVSPDAAGLVTFTNLSINAPKSTDTVVVIKGTLTAIGERTVPTDGTAGAGADTGDIVNVSVSTFADNFHAVGQSSSTVDNVADATLGKDMTVRKSKLVVAREALSSSVLTNGVGVSLMRFTVTADANGAVVIGAIKPAMALGGTAAITAATVKIFDVTGGSDTAMNAVGVNASAIVKFDTPREIAAGQTKTFEIRGTVTGASTTGDSISTSLTKDAAALAGGTVARTETLAGGGVNDASTDANNLFIWSDKSADTHGLTSTEWANSFNLVGWPSSGQTLSVS